MNDKKLVLINILLFLNSSIPASDPSKIEFPLHAAVKRNDLKTAYHLLRKQPELVITCDEEENRPLHYASSYKMVQLIMQPSEQALDRFYKDQKQKVTTDLDPYCISLAYYRNKNQETPLHSMSMNNHHEAALALLTFWDIGNELYENAKRLSGNLNNAPQLKPLTLLNDAKNKNPFHHAQSGKMVYTLALDAHVPKDSFGLNKKNCKVPISFLMNDDQDKSPIDTAFDNKNKGCVSAYIQLGLTGLLRKEKFKKLLTDQEMSTFIPETNTSSDFLFFKKVELNQIEEVKKSLKNGTDPNQENKHTQTALHLAQTPEMVELLISFGADPNKIDQFKQTRLFTTNNAAVASALLDARACPTIIKDGSTVLFYIAEMQGGATLIKRLIDAGVNINHTRYYDKSTALHAAVSCFFFGLYRTEESFNRYPRPQEVLGIIQTLIQNGASLTIKNDKGQTPFDLANAKITDNPAYLTHDNKTNTPPLINKALAILNPQPNVRVCYV